MSRYHSYLNSASKILISYNGEEPFSSFLKKYFASDKKFGSKDRKHITHLCYSYFRLGKALPDFEMKERILVGIFLCTSESNEILSELKPNWNQNIQTSVEEKLLIIKSPFLISEIFPWQTEVSNAVDFRKFCESFLIQPDLFIRLRPGKETVAEKKLRSAGFNLKKISGSALALSIASKLENVIEVDKEAVIQDYSSQRVGDFVKNEFEKFDSKISVWDCCAGSGGKSLLAFDINPDIQLTVSDVRESILANLKKRFLTAGIEKYKSVIIDLTKNNTQHSIINNQQSIIIADVPCTGSGTWSRTPEQLFYFDEKKIEKYASLQKLILRNVITYLQPGGSLVYITCSVFKKENEEIADFLKKEFGLGIDKMELLKGYDKKADSMFVAVLQKEL